MKKVEIAVVGLLIIITGTVIYYFQNQTASVKKEPPVTNEITTETSDVETTNTDQLWSSFKEYQPMEIAKTVELTPTNTYTTGTFCRFYYDENRDEFFSTFGTGQGQPGDSTYIGGGEGGQGAAYMYYSQDLKETGETGYYIYGGGDLATNMIENYFYHLSGGKGGWKITQYNLENWEKINEATIELTENEGANDEMLAYANGMLIASSGYAENANGADTNGKKADPTVGIYTHHHLLNSDLDLLKEQVLQDTRHANGSSLIFVDGVYQFVSTTAYFGDLIVMQYDENWNYLGSKILIEDAQWPQGTVYDEKSEQYYVAYLAVDGPTKSQARIAAFDKNWSLVSNTALTDYDENHFAGRPSVMLHENKLYVTYDKESRDETSQEFTLNKDWQCQLSVIEIE